MGKMVDAEAVIKVCDIYDWDGKGELDLFFLGDIMYALGMNTTKKVCVGLGQTDEEGKKFAKFDEIVEKVKAAAATPDSQGVYADYIELVKLFDKNSRSCSLPWQILRMRTVSSHTDHSSTGSAERHKLHFNGPLYEYLKLC